MCAATSAAMCSGSPRVDTDYSDETFKHILLPIWMAAYKYGGKSYRFMVNGQTGEVQGERPYSPGRSLSPFWWR